MTAMKKKLLETVRHWKWVLFYAFLILAMLPVTPGFLRWKRGLDFPSGLNELLPAIGLIGWILLIVYALRARPEMRLLRTTLLLLIGAIYAVTLKFVVLFPVERLHLVIYGGLGVLAWRATSEKVRTLLRGWRMVAFVAVVSYLDEAFQGIMAARYYDLRDFFMNILAGVLGAAVFSLVSKSSPSVVTTVDAFDRRCAPADVTAAAVFVTITLTAIFVGRSPGEVSELAGTYGRVGRCDVYEQALFDGTRYFKWWDETGNRCEGEYDMGGNYLDGRQVELRCMEAENESECGFQAGDLARGYITILEDRFYFSHAPDMPFMKGVEEGL